MSAFQSISHTAGGYAERLHYKGAKDKCQYKGRYQPFKSVRNFSGSVLSFSIGLVGAGLFGLAKGHKCQASSKVSSIALRQKNSTPTLQTITHNNKK
jgi:hypothetical protein